MTEKNIATTVVLNTRLNRPSVTGELVSRPRLWNMLDAGLNKALTLIVASAGFGKTTLVSSWLKNAENTGFLPSAWLSLDQSISDLNIFLRHFIAALRTAFPNACPETFDLLSVQDKLPANLLSDTLCNEIENLPKRFIIVLDDLHLLQHPAIFDLLTRWFRHWPSKMHMIMLSRQHPPFRLAGLRADGQLTEIRSRDLRFSPEESAEYLHLALKTPLDEETLALLHRRMEGWIVGLKLASLALTSHDDSQALSIALADTNVYIADYLTNEVLANQSPAVQTFLLKASITEQFCTSLCDALIGDSASGTQAEALLAEVVAADLLLIPLDDNREWHRFHHLFRDMLRQRLTRLVGKDEVNDLHRCAAAWYAENEQPDQALHHALEAGDHELASRYIYQGLPDILNSEDHLTLERWLRLLPEDYVRQSPQLMLAKGWEYQFLWDSPQLERTIHHVNSLLSDNDLPRDPEQGKLLRGQLAVLQGQTAYDDSRYEQAITFSREALTLLPDQWGYARGIAILYLGVSMQLAGYAEEAEQYLIEEYQSARDKADSYVLRILQSLVAIYMSTGQHEKAKRTAQIILRRSRKNKQVHMEGYSLGVCGYVYYQENELELAEQHYAEIIPLRYLTHPWVARTCAICLAAIYQAQGRSADALSIIDQLSRFDIEMLGYELPETAAGRAWLMYHQGDIVGAERWVDQAEPPTHIRYSAIVAAVQPTRAIILINRGEPEDIRSALHILDDLDEIGRRMSYTHVTARIEILALRALAQLVQGNVPDAQELLIESVKLAHPIGMIRLYVDMGPKMQKLLYQIADRPSVRHMVARILAAFPGANALPTSIPNRSTATESPTEPLSPRELDVLKLMAESISMKDIANRLGISYATVKRHNVNIYAKLGVHSRWEAVAAANQAGILPPR